MHFYYQNFFCEKFYDFSDKFAFVTNFEKFLLILKVSVDLFFKHIFIDQFFEILTMALNNNNIKQFSTESLMTHRMTHDSNARNFFT